MGLAEDPGGHCMMPSPPPPPACMLSGSPPASPAIPPPTPAPANLFPPWDMMYFATVTTPGVADPPPLPTAAAVLAILPVTQDTRSVMTVFGTAVRIAPSSPAAPPLPLTIPVRALDSAVELPVMTAATILAVSTIPLTTELTALPMSCRTPPPGMMPPVAYPLTPISRNSQAHLPDFSLSTTVSPGSSRAGTRAPPPAPPGPGAVPRDPHQREQPAPLAGLLLIPHGLAGLQQGRHPVAAAVPAGHGGGDR